MNQDQHTYSRAISASLLGLLVQSAAGAGLFILGRWSGSPAILSAVWLALGGLPLWVALWLIYQQHRLERIEALEAEQLSKQAGADSSIFQASADDLRVARRQLERLHRFALPICSLITALYLIGTGLWLIRGAEDALKVRQPILPGAQLATIGFLAGMTLVGFLVSRYLAGMARSACWMLLRGGAGFLMGSVLANLWLILGIVTLVAAQVAWPLALGVAVIPAFMMLIGVEITLNWILGFYRPRKSGEIPRPAFDSRLLSLLTSPESIARTVSEAVNYQFGFEITRSWFWQLLARAFGWLIGFGVAVMLLISCIVIVEPRQRAIVTRFGRLAGQPLGPGIHLKWPWPAGQARRYDVTTVRRVDIGSTRQPLENVPILWSNQHESDKADPLIVAPTPGAESILGGAASSAPSVSLMIAEIALHYRISADRLMDYIHSSADIEGHDPEQRLRELAGAEAARFALRHDVDQWIGSARVNAGSELARIIQRVADQAKLGVEIVNVSMSSLHPPQEVAEAFHQVIGAEQEKQTAIERARQEAIERLTLTAGSPQTAEQIIQKIAAFDKLRADAAAPAALAAAEAEIESLLAGAGGEAAVKIAEARGYRWKRENAERAKAERFGAQLAAYKNAPEFFKARHYLQIVADALVDARKYIVAADRDRLILRGDFKDVTGGFGSILDAATRKPGGGK